MKKEIINNLTDSKPIRAVQLADGRWVTENLARSMGINLDRNVTLAYPTQDIHFRP